MSGNTWNEHDRLVHAFARYLQRSGSPVNVSDEARYSLLSKIIERDSVSRDLDIANHLHRMEIELHTLKLKIENVENEKISKSEFDRLFRNRIGWSIAAISGIATIIAFIATLIK